MKIEIDGKKIKTDKDFHDIWAKSFDIEPFYGKNLSALRDSITAGVERPIHIIWNNSQISKGNMGDKFDKIVNILKESEEHDKMYNDPNDRFVLDLK